jgi:hypothetical protein
MAKRRTRARSHTCAPVDDSRGKGDLNLDRRPQLGDGEEVHRPLKGEALAVPPFSLSSPTTPPPPGLGMPPARVNSGTKRRGGGDAL